MMHVGRIAERTVIGPSNCCVLGGGMKFKPSAGRAIKASVGVVKSFVYKHGWVFLIVGNLVIAIAIGVSYSHIQKIPSVSETVSPSPSPSRTPVLESLYNLSPKITTSHWVSWAILDTKTGVFAGSVNWDKPSYLMSMIKPWIAADYFNLHPNPSPSVLAQLSSMILDSNDQVAYQYFAGQPSWDRFVNTCGITDIVYRSWSWSRTEISARDAARYGECIYSGRATSPKWTAWIVDKMRHVRGDGDFGPRELFQDRTLVATKNGWFNWEGKWYINCLAMMGDWVIAIFQQWPYAGGDLKYGISLASPVCNSIANQVLKFNV